MPGCDRHIRSALLSAALLCALATTSVGAQEDAPPEPEALRAALVAGSITTRLQAVADASSLPGEEGDALLYAALGDAAAEVRRLAAYHLGRRPDIDTARLEGVADDDAPGVRVAALHALAQHPDAAGLERTLLALADPDDGVQLTAAESLATYKSASNPLCEPLLGRLRVMLAGDDGALVTEALARTVLTDGGAAACGLVGEERAALEAAARRYDNYRATPELNLLGRDILERVAALRSRINALSYRITPSDREYCVYPIVNSPLNSLDELLARVEVFGRALAEGDAAAVSGGGENPESISRQISMLDEMVSDLELCLEQEHGTWSEPDLWGEPLAQRAWWMQLGLESHYDDHFFANRADAAELRVTDQLTQRVHTLFQWTSQPRAIGAGPAVDGPEDHFMRVRGELGADIFFGEHALSGAEAWADFYGHLELGSDETYLFTQADVDLSRGLYDAGYPERLVAPNLRGRALVGFRTSPPYESPAFAIAARADSTFYLPTDVASPEDALRSPLLPEDITDADRHLFSLLARATFLDFYDYAFVFDAFIHGVWQPTRLGLDPDDGSAAPKADGWALHAVLEPGVIIKIEQLFRAWIWIGVDIMRLPEPSNRSIIDVTAEAWIGLWEGDRSADGGRILLGAYRRVHDGPGLEDLLIRNGGEVRMQWWARDSDFFLELDFHVFGHLLEFIAADETERNGLQVGLALRMNLHVGDPAPALFIDFATQAERADDRQPIFLETLGRPRVGEPDDAFWRNTILIGVYIPFGGANPGFREARRGRSGLSLPQSPVIPVRWWNE